MERCGKECCRQVLRGCSVERCGKAGGWQVLRWCFMQRRGKSRVAGSVAHPQHIQKLTPCRIRRILHACLLLSSIGHPICSLVAFVQLPPWYRELYRSSTRPPFPQDCVGWRPSSRQAKQHQQGGRRDLSRSNRIIDQIERNPRQGHFDKNGQGRRTGFARSLEPRCFSHPTCEPNFEVTKPMRSTDQCMPTHAATPVAWRSVCHCMPLHAVAYRCMTLHDDANRSKLVA